MLLMIKENLKNDILIYSDEDNIKVEVLYGNENVWLNTETIAELFDVKRPAITKHINNIYNDQELNEASTCSKMEHVGETGQKYQTKYYNLDMIISIGYRVNSKVAIKFRTWATKIIKDYMIQGFVLDDERFMKARKGDQEYFKRLLERIKLIRTSERMFYQKITDIFAECSIDYDKTSDITQDFYATIQNKFHYAITKKTAAELICDRVNSKKDNMGLTSWKESPGGKILKSDVAIAKNYLSAEELSDLNDIVNMYLDLAENRAKRQIPMKMQDWVNSVDVLLSTNMYEILQNKGNISAEIAKLKAEEEYDKYRVIQEQKYISDFDKVINDMKTDNND